MWTGERRGKGSRSGCIGGARLYDKSCNEDSSVAVCVGLARRPSLFWGVSLPGAMAGQPGNRK